MKYLLLLLVLMAIVFISGVRKGRAGAATRERRDDTAATGGTGRASAPPSPLIVACAECGTHLPQGEALPGRGGHFCCAEHRARHEARQGHG